MSDQRKNKIIVFVMGFFLFSFSIGALLKPDDKISLSERRPLKQFPALDSASLLSGKFMEQFDSYAVDQFPLRESFRSIYSTVSLDLLRKSDIEGLYLKGGNAVAMEYPIQKDSLEHASKVFRRIYDTCLKGKAEHIYFSVIPDKSYFFQKDSSVLTMDYTDFFQTLKELNPQMDYIDITPFLELPDYYLTDPHWRQEEIISVAEYLADSMGTSVLNDFHPQIFTENFRGTYAGQSAKAISGEPLYYLTSSALEQCTVFDHQNNREMSMYDFAKGNGKDPYELFLSGSLSYITIENPTAMTDKELILFRDSFGSSIAPLLATGYQKITLLDIRYLPSYSLSSQIDFQNKDVLFLYSTSVLNHSETLK